MPFLVSLTRYTITRGRVPGLLVEFLNRRQAKKRDDFANGRLLNDVSLMPITGHLPTYITVEWQLMRTSDNPDLSSSQVRRYIELSRRSCYDPTLEQQDHQ